MAAMVMPAASAVHAHLAGADPVELTSIARLAGALALDEPTVRAALAVLVAAGEVTLTRAIGAGGHAERGRRRPGRRAGLRRTGCGLAAGGVDQDVAGLPAADRGPRRRPR